MIHKEPGEYQGTREVKKENKTQDLAFHKI